MEEELQFGKRDNYFFTPQSQAGSYAFGTDYRIKKKYKCSINIISYRALAKKINGTYDSTTENLQKNSNEFSYYFSL